MNRHLSKQQRLYILTRDNHTCRYCGGYAMQVDHVIPHSKTQNEEEENLVACCGLCNMIANDKVFDSFESKRAHILERRKEINKQRLIKATVRTINPISEWIRIKYLERQLAEKNRVTIGDFSKYLGVHQVTLSRWLSGDRIPDRELIPVLADKLGDEIYDVMGMPRPDNRLKMIIENWGHISEEQRNQLSDYATRSIERIRDEAQA